MAITGVDTTSNSPHYYSRRSFLAGVIACGTMSAAVSYALSDRPRKTVELRLASGDDPTGARSAAIDAFNARSATARVVLVPLTSETADQKKTMRDWAEAGHVDIVNLDVIHIREFADAGLIEPVPLPNPADFLDRTLDLVGDAGAGRHWAAPFNTDVGMLFRRRPVTEPLDFTMLDLATVLDRSVVERSPVRALRRFAGQLQPATSAADEAFVVNVLEHALSRDQDILGPLGEVSFDVDRWRTALAPLREAIRSGRVAASSDEDDTLATFDGRGLGFMRNWPVRYRYLQNDRRLERGDLRIGLHPMRYGVLGGQSLAVVRRSRYVEEAQEAVRYLSDTPAQRILATHGLAPTRIGAYNDQNLMVLMPHLTAVRGAVETGRPRPMHRNYAAFSRAVRRYVHPYLHGPRADLPPRFTDDLTNALT